MKRDHTHKNDQTNQEDHSSELFARADIAWDESKEEIWENLSDKLKEKGRPLHSTSLRLPSSMRWIAIAASLALPIAIALFLRFYTSTTVTLSGVHTSVQLPDGSSVELNAETTLNYHPYWWRISRSLKLEGEAFFKVTPGTDFTVTSVQATTKVVGTSFNIYARQSDYRVECHSGKVRVISAKSTEQVLLTPNQRALLEHSGKFNVTSLDNERDTPPWVNNLLMFSSTPLSLVFEEIERQYGIEIVTPEGMYLIYSGNFALEGAVEDVLTLLCRPFDLLYEQKSRNTYTIYPAD
jgi:ferric-dicitrate binding protein FerR (iron transport regulator)